MLDVKLLGTPLFERDGIAVAADTRKASALLAYLALEGPTRRDTLAALLWPESGDSQARATLRRTLSALRSAMGDDVVESDREQARLTPQVNTDVALFTSLIAESTAHDHEPPDVCALCIGPLRQAVDIYRGDFLSGFSLRDSPQFEDWTRSTAERLRLEVGRVYERLAAAYAARGDYHSATETVNTWIELDPLREPAYRQLMLLHAWAGDGAGATEAYRRCVATFDRELGVDPLEETTELHEAILDNDLPPAPGERRRVHAKPSLPPASPLGLIDRVTEMETLLEALSAKPSGRVIRIVGEAWLGKTRLLEEVKSHAEGRGMTVVEARGYRAERQLPHGVVSQLLSSVIRSSDWPTVEKTTPTWTLNEAARVHPDLGTPVVAGTSDTFGETRLFEAVYRLLTATPKILIVDDAQWADQTSLSLLAFIANRIGDTDALMLVAHRPDEERVMTDLIDSTRPPTHLELSIRPIEPSQIESLVSDAENLVLRTGGIPALIAESLATGATPGPTIGIRLFMETRLADLDDLTHQVLTAAAVLNGTCDLDLLRATSGRSEEEVLRAVETLTARDLLRARDDGSLEFALDSLESLVYEETNLVRRRLLHRRAAEALEKGSRADTDAGLATTIARHYLRCGMDGIAAGWYLKAGHLARAAFATSEAVDSYRAALALGHPAVAMLHVDIGDALLFMGRFSQALAEFEKAAAFGEGPQRAIAEHRIGEANRRLGRIDAAVSQFEMARANHPDPVSLYCDWALALLRAGDRKSAREKADRAVVAAEGGPDTSRSRALAVLGIVSNHRAESHKALQQALKLAGNDPALRMAALNALSYSHARMGEDAEATSHLEAALEIARRIGDRHRQAALNNHLADLHHRAGRAEQAEHHLTEAVKLFAEVEPGSWEPEVWLLTQW